MVEWKKLGDIAKCYAGATPSTKNSSYWEGGIIPWMSSGEVHQGIVTYTATHITQLGYDNSSTKMLPKGSVVIALAGQGKTRGSVAITDIELCTNQSLCGIVFERSDIVNKYVYYFLGTRYNHLRKISSGEGTRGGLNLKMISDYVIPIPAISEQKRIVGILDTFTASIDNLKEQIAQRRKQYEYYRDQLLNLEGKEGLEMKTLNDLCKLITKQTGFDYTNTIKPSLTVKREADSIPFIQNKDFEGTIVNLNTDFFIPISVAQKFPKILLNDKILLVSISGRIGNVGLYEISDVSFVGGAICVCRLNKDTNGRYVLYFLQSQKGQGSLFHSVKAASHANITVEAIRKTIVPLPPLSEQQRIVDILDKFEASIQNLEAQLSQREKQYEYYRNKLLTF